MGNENTKTSLTAIILNAENLDYNEQYRALTIPEGGTFSVSVKEYQDEKKRIDDEIKIIDDKIKSIETNTAIEEQRYLDQANERLRSSDNNKWIKKETYEGREMTFAEVSYKENLRIERAKTKKLITSENTKLTNLNKSLNDLETTYSKIAWAWNLAKKRTDKPNGKHEGIGTGHTIKSMTLGSHVYGGGFAWMEPFWDEEESKPTGSTKNGVYVHTKSENPKPIIAEWYARDESGNPIKLTNPVKAGSRVELHIYTQSMYGHNIGVELKGNGKVLPANSYSVGITVTSKNGKTIPNEILPKPEIAESENLFLTEVDIHDCTDANSAKPPAEAITGSLTDDLGNDRDGKRLPVKHVQKAILYVNIDPIWTFGVNGLIEVVPTIHSKIGKTEIQKSSLQIIGNSSPEMIQIDKGNMPVFIDGVETNFEAFHHCRYEKITAKFQEDDNPKEIPIFNSQGVTKEEDNLIFPFVVGCDEAKREFEIIVEGSKTDECSYDTTENDHQNQVINTSAIEARIIKGEGKYSSKWRAVDTPDEIKGGKRKTEQSDDENDDRNITTSHITNKFTFINGISKISAQKSFSILEKKTPFEFEKIPDQQIKMKIGYDYTFGGSVSPLVGLCYTFLPYNDSIMQKYPVKIDTCAYQKNLNINIYPDTKWTIQLGFNYDKEKFNEVRTKYHDKWKLQGLEAEEEKKRLQGKLEGTEENLKKYAEEKRKANKNDKGEWQGKIDRQRRKEANLGGRINDQQEVIDQSKRKNSRGGQLSNAFDLMEPKNALASGLIDCEVGIIAEFDRPYGALDLTSGYSEIIDFIKKIADIKEKVDNIINGKDGQSIKNTPKENPERTQKLKAKLDEKKSKGTKKSNWNFEFIPPSIGLSVGWYAERPKDIDKPVIGTMIEGVIDLNPLFGFEITYDVYQLLYKIKHPAVLAVVATLDILDNVLGDNFDINLDFIITTVASGTLKGTINTAEGSNYTDRLMKDTDDTPAKFGGSVRFVLKGFIQGNASIETFIFGAYKVGGEVEASLEAGIAIDFVTKANANMLFLEPEIKVDSFVLKGRAKGYIVKDEEGDEDNKSGVEGETNGEIILTDAYVWEVANWRVPLIKFK